MLPYQTTSRKEDGIVIVGLGGAGASILQRFSGSSAENVRLCIMSLDERLGRECGNVEFVQLGAGLNHGLGSGGDPEVARMAIEESGGQVDALLRDSRLLVMVVGLGGGTGSGVAPVLARKAKDAGIFLVSVVVMPFGFEGTRRRRQADAALEEIAAISDIVFCFENDYMEDLFRSRTGAQAVFEEANALLSQATASVPLLANSPGIINIGLDELVTALDNNDSRCIYGAGKGYGPKRAEDAARAALESPLVAYHGALKHARTVIVHVAGGSNMSLTELRVAMETVREGLAGEDVDIFFGAAVKPRLGEEMRVSIIASVDYREMQAAIMAEPAEEEEAEPEAEPVDEAGDLAAEEEIEETEEPYVTEAEDAAEEESGAPLLEPDDEFVPESPVAVPVPAAQPRCVPDPEPLPSWEPIPAPVATPAAPAEPKFARQGEFNLDMNFGSAAETNQSDLMGRVEDMFGDDDELERMMADHTQTSARPARNINVFPKREVVAAEAELNERVRSMFDDDADDDALSSPYSPASAKGNQSRGPLGFNDMSDMFNPPMP
ncbi:MAG: cell division FtsZ family protein [Akkermansia sp.]|nr:cell division FtsZ family protein [Akkermansia sp.]